MGQLNKEFVQYAIETYENDVDRGKFLQAPLIYELMNREYVDTSSLPNTGGGRRKGRRRPRRAPPIYMMPISGSIARGRFKASLKFDKSPAFTHPKPVSDSERRRNAAEAEKLKRSVLNRKDGSCFATEAYDEMLVNDTVYKVSISLNLFRSL